MASANEDAFAEGIRSLPNEILLMIFTQLPPNILFELQRSSIKRVREMSFLTKIADFSQCRFMSQRKAELFISSMRRNLTELYVDDMICINPTALAKAIMMCKNLCALSVRHSGFSLPTILKILTKLKNVVDFAWSVESSNDRTICAIPVGCGKKWIKLTLDVHDIDQLLFFLITFSSKLSDLIDVELNFYVVGSPKNLANFSEAKTLFDEVLLLPSLSRMCSLKVAFPVTICDKDGINYRRKAGIYYVTALVKYLMRERDTEKSWKQFWLSNIYPKDIPEVVSFSPETKKLLLDDVSYSRRLSFMLDSLKPNSIETLGITSSTLGEDEIRAIQKCGSLALKHFIICNYCHSPCKVKDYDLFESVFKNCRNIVDFDARGIHIANGEHDSLCASISHLKNLKRLCLSVCSISGFGEEHDPSSSTAAGSTPYAVQIENPFLKIIKSCSLVEVFILSGCKPRGLLSCKDNFSDPTLKYLYEWSHLTTLRIEQVDTIRLCSFLVDIAKHCKGFTKLQLISVGHPAVFHFVPNICFMLRNSKSLKHFKIVHKSFNFNLKVFWEAVSGAKSLEGLCIVSKCRLTANSATLVENIEKLGQFSSFHLYCDSEPSQTVKSRLSNIIATKIGKPRTYADVVLAYSMPRDCEFYLNEPACPNQFCYQDMLI